MWCTPSVSAIHFKRQGLTLLGVSWSFDNLIPEQMLVAIANVFKTIGCEYIALECNASFALRNAQMGIVESDQIAYLCF